MRETLRKSDVGITLIALIITIIMLLILASVAFNAIAGENGLIARTAESTTRSKLSSIQQEIEMYRADKEIEKVQYPEREIAGIGLYPVLDPENIEQNTMKSVDESSIADNIKLQLLLIANDADGDVPTYDNIKYEDFYKIDVEKVPSATSYGTLYLWTNDTGSQYKVISLEGIKLSGGNTGGKANVVIPQHSTADPVYVATNNNTFKLYGNGSLTVVGEKNDISYREKSYMGIQPFYMPSQFQGLTPKFIYETVFVIDNNNKLWAWGDNTFNKLGQGRTDPQINEPTDIIPDVEVANVFGGMFNTYVVDTDGNLWGAGDNIAGQLGYTATENYMSTSFTKIEGVSDVVEVQCNLYPTYSKGVSTAIIICGNGDVYGIGSNYRGQMGTRDSVGNEYHTTPLKLNSYFEDYERIYHTGGATFVIREGGTVWATGANGNNGLGFGGGISHYALKQIVKEDGTPLEDVQDIVKLKWSNGVVIRTSDAIYKTAVSTTPGQTSTYFVEPVEVTVSETLGTVNEDSQLLNTGSSLCILNGIIRETQRDAVGRISVYEKYTNSEGVEVIFENVERVENTVMTNVFRADGEIDGQIYVYNYPVLANPKADGNIRYFLEQTPRATSISFVQGNGENLNIVKADGTVEIIKDGKVDTTSTISNVKQMISSVMSTYALLRDGKLYARGDVRTGGWPQITARDNFVEVKTEGDTGESFTNIDNIYTSARGGTMLFTTRDPDTDECEIYWMGTGPLLGYLNLPDDIDYKETTSGRITKKPINITSRGTTLSQIKNKIEDIQLANGNGTDEFTATFILTTDKELYGYSENGNVLGAALPNKRDLVKIDVGGNKKVVSVKTRAGITMAVTEDGGLYAWGYNTYGLMGGKAILGEVVSTPMKLDIDNVKDVELGHGFAIIQKDDGSVYGIGRNEYGQLGDGTTTSRYEFTLCAELSKQ